ncbi:DDE Tnp 4 and/or Plant tran domain containing protein, partial [Asbolus verrucosus]
NIIARWPGSVHDSTIFNDSPLRVDLENGQYQNGYLLGDNGYPCKKYLLTPFLNPNGPAEEAYNVADIATRNPIERFFGLLKRRFPCLYTELKTKLENSVVIII